MAHWDDDSWRDGYDAWKLRSPDDEYPADECDHDDYDIDILSGRAECNRCPHGWYVTREQIDAEIERQANYHEDCERWERQERRRAFWLKITRWIRWPVFRLLEKVWPRKALSVLDDEEIPF